MFRQPRRRIIPPRNAIVKTSITWPMLIAGAIQLTGTPSDWKYRLVQM